MSKKEKTKNLTDTVLIRNPEKMKWQNRVLIGTPTLGLVRVEWMHARYHQTIPTSWSQVEVSQFMSSYIPMEYQVADAYNLIAKVIVEKNFEWLLTIESDNVLPPDGFLRMNEYMIEKKVPVVSGLYFTKSDPPEPLIYRGVGWGHFEDWKLGDKVWADGIPNGFTLIHGSIIKAMWKDAPEYMTGGTVTRRVWITPNSTFYDPETGAKISNAGTQDLDWCLRVIKGKYLEKAGWGDFVKKHSEHPFLVDTDIRVRHITNDGVMYPITMPEKYLTEEQKLKGFTY